THRLSCRSSTSRCRRSIRSKGRKWRSLAPRRYWRRTSMELAICTDVYADLSYTDMLDKVKSLGIDAVEMTAGGWGARTHCPTAELLADEGRRAAYMQELTARGMRISALNTSCNPL